MRGGGGGEEGRDEGARRALRASADTFPASSFGGAFMDLMEDVRARPALRDADRREVRGVGMPYSALAASLPVSPCGAAASAVRAGDAL